MWLVEIYSFLQYNGFELMAIVGPIMKKASPGPLLFKQDRIGENRKYTKIIHSFIASKFLSFYCNIPNHVVYWDQEARELIFVRVRTDDALKAAFEAACDNLGMPA